MLKFTTSMSAQGLLAALADAGLLDAGPRPEAESFIVEQTKDKDLPLYLRILSAVGAFIAALCFIGFLWAAKIIRFENETSLLVWGAIFIGAAIALAMTMKEKDEDVTHSFLVQTSLCSMGVGKILFVLGIDQLLPRSTWNLTLGIFIVTVGTYFLYRLSIDRFLSVLALLVSIFMNLVDRHNAVYSVAGMNILFLAQMGLAGLFLADGKIKREHMVLAYAAAFSLCFTELHRLALHMNDDGSPAAFTYVHSFIDGVLVVALIGLIGWAAGNLEKLKSEPLMIALAGVLLLGALGMPGLLLALCLMVLGYGKHEWLLTGLGVLLMPLAIFDYYYSLNLTLLAKSGILVGSGMVLLAGRAYLAARKLDGRTQS